MRREERQLVRYRAMFRHYPDALTPSQVQVCSEAAGFTVSAWGGSTGSPRWR